MQTLTITVTFNTKQNPGTEEHLRTVLRNFLQRKGALQDPHITIDV